jgi:hypothetical protein
VDDVLAERRKDAALPKGDMLDCVVIGEHGNDGIAVTDVGRPLDHHGAIHRKLVGSCAGTIVDRKTMARFEQTTRHRAAHVAETQ